MPRRDPAAREQELTEILLQPRTWPMVAVVRGPSGSGKTPLLKRVARIAAERGIPVAAFWGEYESEYSPDAVAMFVTRATQSSAQRRLVIVEEMLDHFEFIAPMYPRWQSSPPRALRLGRCNHPRAQVESIMARLIDSGHDIVISTQTRARVRGDTPAEIEVFIKPASKPILFVDLNEQRELNLLWEREPRERSRLGRAGGQP